MPKKLQVIIDDKSATILDRLYSKSTKSIFVNMAIKSFAETKDGKFFLNTLDPSNKDDKLDNQKLQIKEKTDLKVDIEKKVKIEEWS
ncbi:MAG: hypothetical protein PHE16_09925 [Aliarcobacter sp.]|nr:hypothetical protein [Aliarcobacter sp.]